MDKTINELHNWLKELTNFSFPDWKSLPNLDLYMDQVITYLERELAPLMVEDKEKMITSWMINNYVKGGLLSSPVQKKYSKDHLGYMFAICAIKQILSISDIARLFNFENNTNRKSEQFYQFIRETQADIINSVVKDTTNNLEAFINNPSNDEVESKGFLHDFVYKLSIEAEVKKIIADKILYLISKNEEIKRQESERVEKERLEKEKIDKEKLAKSKKTNENLVKA